MNLSVLSSDLVLQGPFMFSAVSNLLYFLSKKL